MYKAAGRYRQAVSIAVRHCISGGGSGAGWQCRNEAGIVVVARRDMADATHSQLDMKNGARGPVFIKSLAEEASAWS